MRSDYYHGHASYEKLDNNYTALGDPQTLITAAHNLAQAQVAQNPPEVLAKYAHWEKAEELAVSNRTGLLLSRCVSRSSDLPRFRAAVQAVEQWLPDCGLHKRKNSWPPVETSLPASEIREQIFERILSSPWINNFANLESIVDDLTTLIEPSDLPRKSAATQQFSLSMKANIGNTFRSLSETYARHREMVVLLSAMTDSGILDESVWGKVGISNLDSKTPFAVTEETWRRFILEQRDCYAPKDERTHVDVIGKYCFNVLRKVFNESGRHADNVQKLDGLLGVSKRHELRMPLKTMVQVANGIAAGQQRHLGVLAPTSLLPDTSRASVGPALDIVLQVTRQPNAIDVSEQSYRDSIHVEIVHELGMLGVDLQRFRSWQS